MPLALNSLYTLITHDEEELSSSDVDQVDTERRLVAIVKDYEVRTNPVIQEEDSDEEAEVSKPEGTTDE